MNATHTTRTEMTFGEPDAHVVSRHLRTALRGLIVVALVAAVLLLFLRPEATYLAVIPIPVLYIVLQVVNHLERRTRASKLRHKGQTELSAEEIDADIKAAGLATALKIVGALALGTFVIVVNLFDVAHVAFIAAVALLLVIFMGLPYWPLLVAGSGEDERDKVIR